MGENEWTREKKFQDWVNFEVNFLLKIIHFHPFKWTFIWKRLSNHFTESWALPFHSLIETLKKSLLLYNCIPFTTVNRFVSIFISQSFNVHSRTFSSVQRRESFGTKIVWIPTCDLELKTCSLQHSLNDFINISIDVRTCSLWSTWKSLKYYRCFSLLFLENTQHDENTFPSYVASKERFYYALQCFGIFLMFWVCLFIQNFFLSSFVTWNSIKSDTLMSCAKTATTFKACIEMVKLKKIPTLIS